MMARSTPRGVRLTAKLRQGVMDSNFHFAPARTGERTAYGARTPDASPASIFEWAEFMGARGGIRGCCVVGARQLAGVPVDLETQCTGVLVASCVLLEPSA